MKKGNKKTRNIILLLVILLTVTVGFALLSTTLFINGTSTIKSNTWNIHWDSESVNVTTGSKEAEDPTVTNDTVSFAVNFDIPGDYYEFTVDAKNEGTIDGILQTITPVEVYDSTGTTKLTGDDIPDNIIFTVTYDDDTAPAVGDILRKNTSKTYKVRVEFDSEATELPADAVSYVYKFSVNYQQYKESANQTPAGPVSLTASKTTASVGENVTVTVGFTAAGWNLAVAGDVTETGSALALSGYTQSGDDEAQSFTFTVDTSTAGTKTITVTGDITDGNEVTTDNISKTITITVE